MKNVLKDLLEEKFGSPINSSLCASLAIDIESQTKEHIGATTLKRLLGFTTEKAEPRESTLEILAKYLGFESRHDLMLTIRQQGDSEFDHNPSSVFANNMPAGQIIHLAYSPNRELALQHIEGDKFVVIKSVNGSLRPDDIVSLDSITSGLPLIIKDVVRHGISLGTYTAGKNYGIEIIK